MIEELRAAIHGEEFDYLTLLQALRQYDRPRDKITSLLRQSAIQRVKKGIYVFGEKFSHRPYSREVLANMIYGPSYVSLDSALQYYGLIPEGVEAVTSVTCGRGRRFSTPAGLFIYRRVSMRAYSIGFDQVKLEAGRFFLIAVPEKALADKLQDDRGASIRNQIDMKSYFTKNLRMDMDQITQMDAKLFAELAIRYRSRKLRVLSRLVMRLQRVS